MRKITQPKSSQQITLQNGIGTLNAAGIHGALKRQFPSGFASNTGPRFYSGSGVAGVLLGSFGCLMYSVGSSPVSVFRKVAINLASAGLSRLPVW